MVPAHHGTLVENGTRLRLIGKCNLLRLNPPDKYNLVMFRKMGESGSTTTFILAGVYYCTTV